MEPKLLQYTAGACGVCVCGGGGGGGGGGNRGVNNSFLPAIYSPWFILGQNVDGLFAWKSWTSFLFSLYPATHGTVGQFYHR